MEKIFANAMLYFRKKAHLSQKELAAKMNISQSEISKLEEGIHLPTIHTLSRFCRSLEISGNEFLLLMAIQMLVLVFTQVVWLDDDDE